MKLAITIEATPKEIADLVAALQSRQTETTIETPNEVVAPTAKEHPDGGGEPTPEQPRTVKALVDAILARDFTATSEHTCTSFERS